MRQTVQASRRSSIKQAATITKAPTKPAVRQDPKAAALEKNNTKPPPTTSTRLAISHGSIFRWRPSQSLGFQVAAVTAKTAFDYGSKQTSSTTTSSVSTGSSSTTNLISMTTYSTLPSDWTLSENSPSTSPNGGSTLFVISKIDPWGPMAIFAPQLKVGMRIVAINHQPCPKTQQGLQALLESSHHHSPTNPEAPAPAKTTRKHQLGGRSDDDDDQKKEKQSESSSSTGWITIHAVDLKEELKQRQYYLSQVGRGLDSNEQRSEESCDGERPVLEEGQEEEEGINVIQVEIVMNTKELQQGLEKSENNEDATDPELKQQLKALHFLEEERQRALFHEAKEKKKEKRNEKRERQRLKYERYMDKNIWNMKLKDSDAHSGQKASAALDNFSILPAASSKKPELKRSRKNGPSKEEMEAMEKLQEVRELNEIHKKVQSIQQGKKTKKNAEETEVQSKDHEKKEPVVEDVKAETSSDWNPFASLQKMLLSSHTPPPTSPPQAKAINPTTKPPTPLALSDRSMGSSISSKASSRQDENSNSSQAGGWFSGGWSTKATADEESFVVDNIIDKVPKIMEPKISISPQRWSCLPIVETKSARSSSIKEMGQKVNEDSRKKDPEGVRAVADDDDIAVPVDCPSSLPEQNHREMARSKRIDADTPTIPCSSSSNQPEQFQLRKIGKREKPSKRVDADAPAPPFDFPSNQPEQFQLRKLGKKEMQPKRAHADAPAQVPVPVPVPAPVPVDCPSSQPAQVSQLQKVGKCDTMRPKWSPHFESYNDSMHSKTAASISEKHCQHATVGQLRQLMAHLEMTQQAQQIPKHPSQPMGKTNRLENRAMPFPEQARRRNLAEVDELAHQFKESQRNPSIPSHISGAASSASSSVSRLRDDQEIQGTIQSLVELALLAKEQKAQGNPTKATGANTTTAFTLPVSRSKSSDKTKKQLKKLQATWKAARLRNIQEAKEAAQGASRPAGTVIPAGTSGSYQDWNVSSLFMSFFHCGEMENGVLDSKYDTPL